MPFSVELNVVTVIFTVLLIVWEKGLNEVARFSYSLYVHATDFDVSDLYV
jgi:hypothetical protein